MRYFIAILVLIPCLVACGPPKPASLKIGEATYRFPSDAVIDLHPNDAYVNFDFGRSADGRFTNSSIKLEYNEGYNRRPSKEPFPSVRWLTNSPNVRDMLLVKRSWGTVVCDRDSMKYDSPLSCGTTFIEAGAKWQVLFRYHKLNENRDIISEARTALHMIRTI
jgi:hypothetical protein